MTKFERFTAMSFGLMLSVAFGLVIVNFWLIPNIASARGQEIPSTATTAVSIILSTPTAEAVALAPPPQLDPGVEWAVSGHAWSTPTPPSSESTSPPRSHDPYVGELTLSSNWPESISQWSSPILQCAEDTGFDPNLIAADIMQESGGQFNAGKNIQTINGEQIPSSSSGAVGLMQVMPRDGMAATFMCRNGPCFGDRPTAHELLDDNPGKDNFNIRTGCKLLKGYTKHWGSVRDGLYHYGPMNVGYAGYADLVLNICRQYAPGSQCEAFPTR